MIVLVAALMMAAAGPDAAAAPAAPATPPPVEKTAADTKPKSDVVCWDETPTGTRFSHKVCATRDQIDQRRRDDQDWKMRMRVVPPQGAN